LKLFRTGVIATEEGPSKGWT